jgi:hypothetical protein
LLPELRERYPDLPFASTDELHGPNRLFEATTRLLQRWAARRPLVLLLDFFEEMTTRMGIKNVSHIVAMHK